jgi:chemotaxis protein CheZ
MPQPPVPMPLSEADYELIEAAVMETERGRWFLGEYARRNRHADTMMLLGAIERLAGALRAERTVQPLDRIRSDLFAMAEAIARTKAEIAAIKPDIEDQGKFREVTAELDSIVHTTEAATSDILAAAEQVQEIAWTLREQGLEAEACDLLNAKATDIYTACAFQDLTGQRTGKVIQVLRYLEDRINAMIDIWGLEGTEPVAARALPLASEPGLDQADVDVMMDPAGPVADDHEVAKNSGPSVVDADRPASRAAEPSPPEPTPASPPRPTDRLDDPLRPIVALSPEERIALFT